MYFELYQDAKGEWRWRLKAANHQIVATGGEGYSTKQSAMKGINVVKAAADAEVREI